MKMAPELEEAFNRQVTMELSSATAYLQMAAYFEDRSLNGMGRWMRLQSEEERGHALLFLDFVLARGNRVRIGEVAAPTADFSGPEEVFAAALDQERAVTAAIHDLYRMATDSGDLGSLPFLQSFIAEQNEEEAMVEAILERVQLAAGDGGALLLLDRELGARTSSD